LSTGAFRTGIGYDSHRFDAARKLRLGGVTIPGVPGLAGHSDGDAICHAVTDAILGAAGLGDIGGMFPDTDPAHKNADSLEMLRAARERLAAGGWRVVNVDAAIVAERPRIAPHREAMIRTLAPVLGVDRSGISLKGTTNEGMGWIGRGEGIAVMAVATVSRPVDANSRG